jgi:hypothetical protein
LNRFAFGLHCRIVAGMGVCLSLALLAGCRHAPGSATPALPAASSFSGAATPLPPVIDDIERRTFDYFWETTDAGTGLAPDRHPSRPFSSIAAIGFALTAYPIGAERGWITRGQAAERTLATLRFLHDAPMGPEAAGRSGHRGFYYHFLDMRSGHRFDKWVELSSVDTGLMMMGVLFAQSYYDGDDAREREIRSLAETLYGRVEWDWMRPRAPLISMGWNPDTQSFIDHDWKGYNEAMLVYVLALGSPTHPVEPEAWTAWTRSYGRNWGEFQGQTHLRFGPQFGHQYSHVWIDFRGIQDAYMREKSLHDKGLDYFENSRRAALAQHAYAVANPMGWKGYDDKVWGLTASDGPQGTRQIWRGQQREFRGYSARGPGPIDGFDDGTLAPTAALASLPFAPDLVIPAAEAMRARYGDDLYGRYGFLDAFNPSFEYDVPLVTGKIVPGKGWFASDYLGIDQGPILAMIANHRDGFVWNVMKRNPHIRRGLERAGFRGGWLEAPAAPAR